MSPTKKSTFAVSGFGFALCALLLLVDGCRADIEDNELGKRDEYHTMLNGVQLYKGDRECVLQGGVCVHTSDCLLQTTNKGLCPSNADRGVECCYEVPIRPALCRHHEAECMDRCPKSLIRPGTDCQNGQVCCVLIH